MDLRRSVSTLLVAALAATLAVGLAACGGKHSTGPGPRPPRTYVMGFSPIAPRADLNLIIQTVLMWSTRADAAIIHSEPPWDSLLAGVPAETLVTRERVELVNFFRALGMSVVLMVDATNGINRAGESQPLVDAGRSLAEPEVQFLYRRYCTVLDSLLRPDWMGLAAETNLIRAAAPPALYAAVVQVANDAAADIRAIDAGTPLFISVQVETAWGVLGGSGAYEGVAQDVTDFPFMDAMGLSSYPYFAWSDPDSLPDDYYARLRQGNGLPVLVVEGGWTSRSIGGIGSSPATQARYVARHAELLDRAQGVGLLQLTFTDLDTTALPPGTILPYFSYNGLVDENLVPKPALAEWDAIFARPGP